TIGGDLLGPCLGHRFSSDTPFFHFLDPMSEQPIFPPTIIRSTPEDVMVELRNVNLTIGHQCILRDIDMVVNRNFSMAILGNSGAGKSTILKLILGLMKPDSGEVFVDGEEISSYTEDEMLIVRQKLGMVFQESALFDSLTVQENVGYVLYERSGLAEKEIRERVLELLALVEIEEMIDKMPGELSGGQRRRVAIARAMAASPEIILYDEPTAGLDPVTSNTIIKQMMKLRDFRGVTSILVTHKLEDAFRMAYNVVEKDHEGIKMVKDTTGRRL